MLHISSPAWENLSQRSKLRHGPNNMLASPLLQPYQVAVLNQAHTQCCCRVRMLANMYAFAPTPDLIRSNRASLVTEIGLLRQEYDSLLYGGKINTIVGRQAKYCCRLRCNTFLSNQSQEHGDRIVVYSTKDMYYRRRLYLNDCWHLRCCFLACCQGVIVLLYC